MENKKEMTIPNVSAATDAEQSLSKCTDNSIVNQDTDFKGLYWSSFLVTLCSEIMLYIETPLVSYSYSLNEVSHSCTS